MNIKQAAEQSGVSSPNIRFYEKEGLMTPARNRGNAYRDYTAGDIRTLKLIRQGTFKKNRRILRATRI